LRYTSIPFRIIAPWIFLIVACIPCYAKSDTHTAPALDCLVSHKKITVLSGASSEKVEFELFNAGSHDEMITNVIGDCSCLTFNYDPGSIRPGMSKGLTVNIALKPQTGVINRQIQVDTLAGASLKLRLDIEILPGIAISPTIITWRPDSLVSKRIALVNVRNFPLTSLTIINHPTGYVVTLTKDAEGYEAVIARTERDTPNLSLLCFLAKFENGMADEITVPLIVR